MNGKNRTTEFFALTERIKKRQLNVKVKTHPVERRNTSGSEFSRLAAQLGRNIATTSEKLHQLTYLTKSKNGMQEIDVSLFFCCHIITIIIICFLPSLFFRHCVSLLNKILQN
ncbi:uncharacterized protein BX663DRAFT_523457 [Cokeromyces recurvatus]|uniref:uncharacterized protein n=1 Tax=Cokeromyces recurvatus TaxID=90255 RepID=UPI00221F4DDA|nr:uncharacterized protein BX663DRAFT_523457 [Cokeromyces recurvatus]KAI7898785.1 hypothetical protein BX663DRAFT_523457 [Cokeromyces recurvatus]